MGPHRVGGTPPINIRPPPHQMEGTPLVRTPRLAPPHLEVTLITLKQPRKEHPKPQPKLPIEQPPLPLPIPSHPDTPTLPLLPIAVVITFHLSPLGALG